MDLSHWMRLLSVFAALVTTASPATAFSETPAQPDRSELMELSLEELSRLEVTVTSVSRTPERLSDAAAAITVLSNEDIRRSGALWVPELLRRVPGMHVAQVSASSWAVASRGFSSVQSNKLLVLVDTRSVYTPLFSGVFWDVQMPFLEDVERMEVIRGPGGTLWGANAVNGVVSVTTKAAKKTQGLSLAAGGGTEERALAAARWGGKLGDSLHYRVFSQYRQRDAGFLPGGASDDRWIANAGLRADWEATAKDLVTLQGGAYRSEIGQVRPAVTIIGRPGPALPLTAGLGGGNVLTRWTHRFSEAADLQLRAYYDRTRRDDPTYLDHLQTWDVELQHRFPLPWRQELMWGAGWRLTSNHNRGRGIFALVPPDSRDTLVSGFVQDRIFLVDSVQLTVGSKLEHNDFSGVEVQPSVRLAWQPLSGHNAWGAVSRAVRVPTRLERDVAIDAADPAAPVVPRLLGNPDYGSEQLLAFELGYRWQLSKTLSLDVAGFYNRYRGLASLELGEPFVEPGTEQTVVPIFNQNLGRGLARGGELSVQWRPFHWWRLDASYSQVKLTLSTTGQDINRGLFLAGATPRHQLRLQSSLDLPGAWTLDAFAHSVSALSSVPDDPLGENLPSQYVTLDVRLAWKGLAPCELSVVGQNLVDAHHREFPGGTEVQRGVYGMMALNL